MKFLKLKRTIININEIRFITSATNERFKSRIQLYGDNTIDVEEDVDTIESELSKMEYS